MLEIKNLTKKFGNNVAVNDISFTVQKGKIFGVVGRNGAGKSTTFRMILNIIKMTNSFTRLMSSRLSNTNFILPM